MSSCNSLLVSGLGWDLFLFLVPDSKCFADILFIKCQNIPKFEGILEKNMCTYTSKVLELLHIFIFDFDMYFHLSIPVKL